MQGELSIVDCQLSIRKKVARASNRQSPIGNRQWTRRSIRRRSRLRYPVRIAFSLIEMMIAIVILGFGLIMVASMFPIAWNRARVMSDEAGQDSIVRAAEEAASLLLATPAAPRSMAGPIRASFAGDLLIDTVDTPPLGVLCYSDTRVHQLHMESLLVSPRSYYPDRRDPTKSPALPYQLENMYQVGKVNPGLTVPPGDEPAWMLGKQFGLAETFAVPQIRLESRVFPPLPRPRAFDSVDNTGEFVADDPVWDDLLETRRYAFAIFHRLTERIGPDPADWADPLHLDKAVSDLDKSRAFDLYYVTLRRAVNAGRFAQQDPDRNRTPAPLDRSKAVVVRALPATADLLLPTPWRVQVYIPQPPDVPAPLNARRPSEGSCAAVKPPPTEATGIPTVVHVNHPRLFPNPPRWLVDMFAEGTFLIDEVNGQVYRVASRRLAGRDLEQAFLTLDREIVIEDIDDFGNTDCLISDEESLRAMWVFPPPVLADRLGNGDPIFSGNQPVIGIDVRPLTVSPR